MKKINEKGQNVTCKWSKKAVDTKNIPEFSMALRRTSSRQLNVSKDPKATPKNTRTRCVKRSVTFCIDSSVPESKDLLVASSARRDKRLKTVAPIKDLLVASSARRDKRLKTVAPIKDPLVASSARRDQRLKTVAPIKDLLVASSTLRDKRLKTVAPIKDLLVASSARRDKRLKTVAPIITFISASTSAPIRNQKKKINTPESSTLDTVIQPSSTVVRRSNRIKIMYCA